MHLQASPGEWPSILQQGKLLIYALFGGAGFGATFAALFKLIEIWQNRRKPEADVHLSHAQASHEQAQADSIQVGIIKDALAILREENQVLRTQNAVQSHQIGELTAQTVKLCAEQEAHKQETIDLKAHYEAREAIIREDRHELAGQFESLRARVLLLVEQGRLTTEEGRIPEVIKLEQPGK